MAKKDMDDCGSAQAPQTYPNKPKGGSAKASFAGKHSRAMSHVQPGMSAAATLAKKNRGSK